MVLLKYAFHRFFGHDLSSPTHKRESPVTYGADDISLGVDHVDRLPFEMEAAQPSDPQWAVGAFRTNSAPASLRQHCVEAVTTRPW